MSWSVLLTIVLLVAAGIAALTYFAVNGTGRRVRRRSGGVITNIRFDFE